MKSSPTRHGFLVLAFLLASSVVFAVDIPLSNWTVPPYRAQGTSGGLSTMAEVTPAVLFIGITPCRLVDTRQAGFPAGYGMPALTAGVPRNFDLNNDPLCTSIPTDTFIQAYSLNVTVTNTQGPGFIKIYPQGGTVPFDVSTQNFLAGQTIANAAIVPAGTNGGITVVAAAGTDLIIDINGYFTERGGGAGTNFFYWESANTGTFGAARIRNTGDGANAHGVTAFTDSSTSGAAGIYGQAVTVLNSTAGGTQNTFGGKFQTHSVDFDSAGAKGISGWGDPMGETLDCSPCGTAGLRGVDTGTSPYFGFGVRSYGVLGISRSIGAAGLLLDPADTTTPVDTDAEGYLGYRSTATVFYGVLSLGGSGGTGIKSFIEPHKNDPTKVIRYVTLEGAEAGTYFRGKGKFERGVAVIEVPEDFRMVTAAEGLSIQVTPIGDMATVAVQSIGLDRIVVKGSRNVEFFYTVNGVRATFPDHKAIDDGTEFVPKSADARIPRYLSEGQKQLLIQNGTYKADGTVNMETAQRLGWDRVWAERARQRPQPAAAQSP
jgi:hypothetical protein